MSCDISHKLIVTTGDRKGAEAAQISVYITISHGSTTSPELEISSDQFNRGQKLEFDLFAPEVGRVTDLTIRRADKNVGEKWFVEKMEFAHLASGDCGTSIFPVLRWINVGTHLSLVEFDSSLPQDEKHVEQRAAELRAKRQNYMFSGKIHGAPLGVEILPEDEQFSEAYAAINLDALGKVLKQSVGFIGMATGDFDSLEDFEKVYRGLLPIPKGLENWRSDEEFGNQKVAGCNPNLLELCTTIPKHMPVTNTMVESALEGKTLTSALAAKRMYMIDLRYMADIECSQDRKLPGPTCLLYRKDNTELIPVAIQIMPEPAEDNPIFTRDDPEYTWLAAKMWFNLADCSHHQSCTHLGFTHLLMASVAVCTHRRLSQSHPVFKLLAPHFLFLLAINETAVNLLVNPGGWVDRSMQIGRAGMFNIVKKNWAEWNLKTHGNLESNLKLRKVDDTEALPDYPYRDDSLLIWHAIKNYVTAYVKGVYDSEDKLVNDSEIQAWARALTAEAEVKGCPEKFTSVEDLVEVLTVFIFIGSVQHAAANFGQYDEYAFPPNYPGFLRGERPKTKEALDEPYIVATLPTKVQALDMISITKLLSMFATNELGNFEIQYAYDENAISAVNRFRSELKEISRTIDERNSKRKRPYIYLNPKFVPNAISI